MYTFSPFPTALFQLSAFGFPCVFYNKPQYFVFQNAFHNSDRKIPYAILHEIRHDTYSTKKMLLFVTILDLGSDPE